MNKQPWNTYKYLNKARKNVIDCVDVTVMEEALRRGYYNNFIWVYDTLFRIFMEGQVMLNESQMDVLMLPIKKWGTFAGMVIYEMRQDMKRQETDQKVK